jgi:hypothetical protein
MLGLRFVGGGGAVTPMNFPAIEVIGRGDRRIGGDGATTAGSRRAMEGWRGEAPEDGDEISRKRRKSKTSGEGVTHSRYHDVAP